VLKNISIENTLLITRKLNKICLTVVYPEFFERGGGLENIFFSSKTLAILIFFWFGSFFLKKGGVEIHLAKPLLSDL